MRMETLGGKKEQGSIGCRPQIIIGTLNEFDQRQVRVGGPDLGARGAAFGSDLEYEILSFKLDTAIGCVE